MYDSTSPEDIPVTAELVAGYVDGSYAWSQAGWNRFPTTTPKVGISCLATNAGDVLDIEAGCAVPPQAPGWARARRQAGVDPTVYVNRSSWQQVRSAFMAQGVAEPWYWVATLDGTQLPLVDRVVACQYIGEPGSGGHYDLSIVRDDWFPSQGGDAVNFAEKAAFVRLAYDGFLWRHPSPQELTDQANAIADDGSNLDGQMAGIQDSSEGSRISAVKAQLIRFASTNQFPGPPGPAGPPGPPGPAGPSTPHSHSHPFIGSTGQSS
jgi:hypothetical protein